MQESEEKIKCPKCGSESLHAGKHGFSAGKAVGGALLTGGIGVLVGMHGADKIDVTCLKCGHTWQPVAESKALEKERIKIAKKIEMKDRAISEKKRRSKLSTKDRMIENLISAAIIALIILAVWYFLF